MNQANSVASTPSASKRLLLGLGLVLLVAVTLGLAWWCYVWTQAANRLKATIATLDRQDPGWRWEELQAKRVPVPDAENAALCVEAAFKLLPKGWPNKPVDPNNQAGEKTVVDQILDLEPSVQLSGEQIKELRLELGKVKPALDEARKLDGLTTGRYPTAPPEYIYQSGGYLEGIQHPRPIANLLWAEAALLAHEQQPDAALACSRAILNAGRAFGDDPVALAHLVRIVCRHLSAISTERILAQAQPSDQALRTSQELLQDEEQQPLLLYAVRGERASAHEQMGWMETGDVQHLTGGTATNNWLQQLGIRLGASWTKENHVRFLEVMTEAVEIAHLPLDVQAAKIRDLNQRLKTTPNTAQSSKQILVTMAFAGLVKVSDACARSRAELRGAITALAAERYRLAHQEWPDSLDKLVPEFLPEVPQDPYDRKPLRYQRLNDGVAIYSVGPDGKDDGGKVDRKNYTAPGTDMVFRLWNVANRRQPAATDKN